LFFKEKFNILIVNKTLIKIMTDKELRELKNQLSSFLIYFEQIDEMNNCVNKLKDCIVCEFYNICKHTDSIKTLENYIINEQIPELKKLLKI
jgi:hypothetical protein